MIAGYFVPRFEEVMKRVLDEYQSLKFEGDYYPFLEADIITFEVKE